MRRLLRLLLVENAALKLVSLILAVTLFVLVGGEKEVLSFVHYKLIYTLPANRVLVSDPATELRVGIRGPWSRVNRVDEQELAPLLVDLSRASDGEIRFREDRIPLPPGVRVASISPASVQVRLEARLERVVPVQVPLEGQPATGYRVERLLLNPEKATVTGAESTIRGLTAVATRRLSIAGARGPVSRELELDVLPASVSVVSPLAPLRVRVTAQVVAEEGGRTLRVPVQARLGRRLQGKYETTVEPAEIEVMLSGRRETVEALREGALLAVVEVQGGEAWLASRRSARLRPLLEGVPQGIAARVIPDSVLLTLGKPRHR